MDKEKKITQVSENDSKDSGEIKTKSKPKVTKIESEEKSSAVASDDVEKKAEKTASKKPAASSTDFRITPESKKKALGLRIIAAILWVLAIGCEIAAIMFLKQQPINMLWLIIFIVADLALVIIGSQLWKKANRFDPASEKNKAKFFIQNQLGVIISVIAFLPLIILILTNKNITGKQKGILTAVAVVALAIAGLTSAEYNPPSVEQYEAQTQEIQDLTGGNNVFWTKSGTKYHIYSDCHTINTDRTDEIFEGSVAKARELKNITELCSFCKNKAIKAKGVAPAEANETQSQTEEEPAELDDAA